MITNTEITNVNFYEHLDFFKETLEKIIVDISSITWNHYLHSSICDTEAKEVFKDLHRLSIKEKMHAVDKFFNIYFDKLFLCSHENNLFFEQCSLSVYESTFDNRVIEYKKTFVDDTFLDFTMSELKYLTLNESGLLYMVLNKTNNKRVLDASKKKITFLNNKIKVLAIETEADKGIEVKKELYNHIFKGNAFEVWQSMFDEFEINESSRTDVKFMFEEMRKKGEGLIHNTVSQTTFLDWISETYNGLTIEKTSNYSRTKTRLQAYLRAKELYKK